MVDVKTVVVSVVAVLSVFLQPGIRAQSTIGSSSEDDFYRQLEEDLAFQVVENAHLHSLLESEQQTMMTLENVSNSQVDEIQQLKLELENKQKKIETLENVSSSRAEENLQLNMELGKKQQKIETLGNVSNTKAEEIRRLNLELENKQQKIEKLENERRRLKTGRLQSVTATSISSFDDSEYHYGIAKVEDKIYVISERPSRIKVYEDVIGLRFLTDIALSCTNNPYDIVYSNESTHVYISDFVENCIWVMTTTSEHRLTRWLTEIIQPRTLSFSNEGHLLVLRSGYQLDIYSLNATLVRRLQLPQNLRRPLHVVQTSDGNFIISHRMNDANSGQWVISQLTNDGQLIHRFIPRNQSEELDHPFHLSIDLDSNRLFVADSSNNRVILFDSSDLTWSQVLLSQ